MKNLSNQLQGNSLEIALSEFCLQIGEHSKIGAKSSGLKDLPRPYENSAAPYFEEYHHQYQQLIDKVNTELQFQTVCHRVVIEEKNAEEKMKALRNDMDELEDKSIRVKAQLR
ncbi:MAG: hypothetical protein WC797_03760, partial [Candidatus Paceibacterota bacterium]